VGRLDGEGGERVSSIYSCKAICWLGLKQDFCSLRYVSNIFVIKSDYDDESNNAG
jgi:hypothetical protein